MAAIPDGRRPKQPERRETSPLKLKRGSRRCARNPVQDQAKGASPASSRCTRWDTSRSFAARAIDRSRSFSFARSRVSKSRSSRPRTPPTTDDSFVAHLLTIRASAARLHGEGDARKRKIAISDGFDQRFRSPRPVTAPSVSTAGRSSRARGGGSAAKLRADSATARRSDPGRAPARARALPSATRQGVGKVPFLLLICCSGAEWRIRRHFEWCATVAHTVRIGISGGAL